MITKKNHTYTISDKKTGKSLYHIVDVPVYDNFDLDKPLLSGFGCVMNVPGNYYSFKKYLSNNDDYPAMISDGKNRYLFYRSIITL